MIGKFQEFMIGRNGLDKMSITLIVSSVIMRILSSFFPILMIFALIIFLYAIWRIFSKNLAKRREENYRFVNISTDIRQSWNQRKFRRQQRKLYKFIECPDCKSKLRLPRGKGKISITCPKCGLKFNSKT